MPGNGSSVQCNFINKGVIFGPGGHFRVPQSLQVSCSSRKCDTLSVSCLSFMVLGACCCQSCRFPLGGAPRQSCWVPAGQGGKSYLQDFSFPDFIPSLLLGKSFAVRALARVTSLKSDNQSSIFNSRALFQKRILGNLIRDHQLMLLC